MAKVVFVNHRISDHCGVYQYGAQTVEILTRSKKHEFIGVECGSLSELRDIARQHRPRAFIHNSHPAIMPWITGVTHIEGPIHIGLFHDIHPEVLEAPPPDYWVNRWIAIAPQPATSSWLSIGRPVPNVDISDITLPAKLTIKTFGIAFEHKRYKLLGDLIAHEFPDEEIFFEIHTIASFIDNDYTDERIRDEIYGTLRPLIPEHIDLSVTTGLKSREEVVRWLAASHINVLLYAPMKRCGPSSALDFCISAGRPVLVTDSSQFDHVDLPKYPLQGIRDAYAAGTTGVEKYKNMWTEANFLADYERIIDEVCGA